MSDKELVTIDTKQMGGLIDQLAQLNTNLVAISNVGWGIKDAINNNTTEISKWVSVVAEAISKLTLPQPGPQTRGMIMSDYAIPADQADGRVTFNLVDVTDSEGNVITDPAQLAALGFEATSNDPSVFEVTLDTDQPDGAKRVGGYHVGAPGQAAVTSNLKQADGDLIATGTDGFTVTTGEATLGSVNAEFEGLTPIV